MERSSRHSSQPCSVCQCYPCGILAAWDSKKVRLPANRAGQEINWPDAGHIGTSHGHLLKSMLIDSTGSNSFCTWPKAPTWLQACSCTVRAGKCALRCRERSNGTREMDPSFLHLLLCLVQTLCPDFVAPSKCSILIPLYIFSVSITHKISLLPLLSLTICI